MNERWIEHSHDDALIQRRDDPLFSADELSRYEYLDMLGLFESSWMIFDHDNNSGYGYPVNE